MSEAASGNSIQYTGRENDGTGLYYYRARYYHPVLQRFISEDSIEFAGGDVNLYAYVWNSPVDLTDPSGLATLMRLPPQCRPKPPAPDCKAPEDPAGPEAGGLANRLLGFLRDFACDPDNMIPFTPGLRMAKGVGEKIFTGAKIPK